MRGEEDRNNAQIYGPYYAENGYDHALSKFGTKSGQGLNQTLRSIKLANEHYGTFFFSVFFPKLFQALII